MKYCSYLVAIQFAQCPTKISGYPANSIHIEILGLAQSGNSYYPRWQLPKRMDNANFSKLTLNLTSTDERTNSSVQNFIHSSRSATWLFHTFKKIHHNGISFDLSYVSNYNLNLQNSPP
jgi:hypothetical protein